VKTRIDIDTRYSMNVNKLASLWNVISKQIFNNWKYVVDNEIIENLSIYIMKR